MGLLAYDQSLGTLVAGVDEVGRGCLAGPLIAASVLFDYAQMSSAILLSLEGLDDSKKLSAKKRRELYPLVIQAASKISCVSYPPSVIDRSGLHRVNLLALARAAELVYRPGAILLVDGFSLGDKAPPHSKVIKGDATIAAIAAASIIAKVTRDRLMARLGEIYPGYGFARNAGYLTEEHDQAVR